MTGFEIFVVSMLFALIVGLLVLALLKGGTDTDYTGGAR
jgi:hypothetical protein